MGRSSQDQAGLFLAGKTINIMIGLVFDPYDLIGRLDVDPPSRCGSQPTAAAGKKRAADLKLCRSEKMT